jgi:ABC-type oligopeptide transport system substrate-binding subunit/class 3 adenylate cyclase/ABC-type dipeptide/oligopeptide/nickel transport system ATPase subunit
LQDYKVVDVSEDHQIENIKQAMAELESRREVLGDEVVQQSLKPLQAKLADLEGDSIEIEQQRKQVTLLFMDVVGSTNIAQRLDPEDVVTIMDRGLKLLSRPVEQLGGRITRFMGDGFKAVFGIPLANENDPERAVKAGLKILETAQAYAREIESDWGIKDFTVRVGVNTGLVFIGGETEADLTVMGKAVNLAARLESEAPAGKIIISHDTYQQVRGLFEIERMADIKAKGFDQPVRVYMVNSAKARTLRMRRRGVEGVETSMIGRENELKYLKDALFNVVEEGEGQVVTITGEVGVGKSRLMAEFINWLEQQSTDLHLFQGRAFPQLQGQAYALIRDMFAFQFQIHDHDLLNLVQEKMQNGLQEIFTADPTGQLRIHYIGQLLGFDFKQSPHLRSAMHNPHQLRNKAFSYLGEYFSGLSQQAPVIILLEDIHWADDSSLDATNYLGRRTPDQPILIICFARPTLFERRPYWGEGQTFHRRLEIQPLSRRESRQLVQELLRKVDKIPDQLRELVVEGSEGNPFYIEELINMLIEQGVITRESGDNWTKKDDQNRFDGKDLNTWKINLSRLNQITVPHTLAGVLQARLDSLIPEEKELLQQAAIIGRIFWDEALQQFAGVNHDESKLANLTNLLKNLRSKEMIYRREESTFAGAEEYIFKHELLREVTYESVLKKKRPHYHELVANWLIEKIGKRATEYAAMIANHLEAAGRPDKAAEYLIHGGDRSRTLYAHQESISHYRRAIHCLQEIGDKEGAANVHMKLGLTYHTNFDFENSRLAYQQGFDLLEKLEQPRDSQDLPVAPHPLRLLWRDPPNLDPTLGGTNTTSPIVTQLFSGLVAQSPDLEVIPDIARSWEILEGGKKYIFHLREDVFWSDGMPVTAADFEFTYKRALDPNTQAPVAGLLLYGIRGARNYHQGSLKDANKVGVYAPDMKTLVLEFEESTPYFMQDLSYYVLLPVPKHLVEKHGHAWCEPENIVTNGPFTLSSWKHGKLMFFERYPHYHGHFGGNVQQVRLELGGDVSDYTDKYIADDLDVLTNWFSSTDDIDRLRQLSPTDYQFAPQFATMFLSLNASLSPLNEKSVRQALACALDRERLANEIWMGYYLPALGGFVPPGMPGFSDHIALPYDPACARQLLAEVGLPSGRNLPGISLITYKDRKVIAEFLQRQWRDNVNLDIEIEALEVQDFQNRLMKDQYSIAYAGWWADYADPDNFLRVCVYDAIPPKLKADYDDLLVKARKTTDPSERLRIYREMDRMLIDEALIIPLVYAQGHLMIKPWIKNYQTSALKHPGFWKDVTILPH